MEIMFGVPMCVAIWQSFSNWIQESLPEYTPAHDFWLIDFIFRLCKALCWATLTEWIMFLIFKQWRELWIVLLICLSSFILSRVLRWIAIKVNNLEAYARDKEYKM